MWTAAHAPEGEIPLTVFCSPPFDFYVERPDQMVGLIGRWITISPSGSQIVVEADERFDFRLLPDVEQWDVRHYPPAIIGIYDRA